MLPKIACFFCLFNVGLKVDSMRSVKLLLYSFGYKKLASWTPSFIKIPYWVMTLAGSKF